MKKREKFSISFFCFFREIFGGIHDRKFFRQCNGYELIYGNPIVLCQMAGCFVRKKCLANSN
jgi:hypothetical protein